jgi:hypothetical protein
MIKVISSKTIENLRDGVKDGMDSAWKASRRMQFRSPVVYDKPAMRSGSWIGLGLLSMAAVALGAWLYFRKRKQVADRYTMGDRKEAEGQEPAAAWEANSTHSGNPVSNPAI